MTPSIKVVPMYLELKVGEEKQLQVITNVDDYYVTSVPEGHVEFDRSTFEVEGLKAGSTSLIFKIFNDKGEVVASDAIRIDVLAEKIGETPVRIMLHNKFTDCMYNIVGNSSIQDIDVKLPNRTGLLLTRSQIEGFTNRIYKPSIVTPVNLTRDYGSKFVITKPSYRIKNEDDLISYSYWEFALDEEFENILLVKKQDNLQNIDTVYANLSGVTCYVRARYHTPQTYSEWTDPILVSFDNNAPYKEAEGIQGGSMDKACYYGGLNVENYIQDYVEYRGNFITLRDVNLTEFKVNHTVSYNDVLYRCVQDQTGGTLVTPGLDQNYWVKEDRQNFPTFDVFIRKVGLNVGAIDNNEDSLSFGQIYCGELINDKVARWIKMGYKGKILYVASHPVIKDISWVDLAKCSLVYGNRTFRINGSTYRIRLLTKEEYEDFFLNLTEEAAAMKDVFKLYQYDELLEDWREDDKRMYVTKNKKHNPNGEAGNRAYAYRPVLEYLKPGTEPYNDLPNCAVGIDEELKYDPYTDTGYFGVVSNALLRNTEEVIKDLSWSHGSVINTSTDWHKFYFQGMIIYTPTKIIKNHFQRKQSYDHYYTYPYSLGSGGEVPRIVKNNVRYNYGLMTACTLTPRIDPPSDKTDTVEWGRGSMITELFLRMYTPYNTLKRGRWSYWNGYQVGDAWRQGDRQSFYPNNWCFCAAEYGTHTGTYHNGFSSGGVKHALGGGDHTGAIMLMVYKPYH